MNFDMSILTQVFLGITGIFMYMGCGVFFVDSIVSQIVNIKGDGISISIMKWGLVLTWPVALGAVCILAVLALVLIIFLAELVLFLIVSALTFLILGIPNLVVAIILVILSLIIIGGVVFFIAMSVWNGGCLIIHFLALPFRWRSKKQKEQDQEEKVG